MPLDSCYSLFFIAKCLRRENERKIERGEREWGGRESEREKEREREGGREKERERERDGERRE